MRSYKDPCRDTEGFLLIERPRWRTGFETTARVWTHWTLDRVFIAGRCYNRSFDYRTVRSVYSRSPRFVRRALWWAVRHGVWLPPALRPCDARSKRRWSWSRGRLGYVWNECPHP